MVNPPLIVELAATVSPPPEMTNGSSAVMLWTDSTFELIVTVGVAPETLMATSSFGPGTLLSLQLLATSQEPLVADTQLTVDSICRSSSTSRLGRCLRRLAEEILGRLANERRRLDMVNASYEEEGSPAARANLPVTRQRKSQSERDLDHFLFSGGASLTGHDGRR